MYTTVNKFGYQTLKEDWPFESKESIALDLKLEEKMQFFTLNFVF